MSSHGRPCSLIDDGSPEPLPASLYSSLYTVLFAHQSVFPRLLFRGLLSDFSSLLVFIATLVGVHNYNKKLPLSFINTQRMFSFR